MVAVGSLLIEIASIRGERKAARQLAADPLQPVPVSGDVAILRTAGLRVSSKLVTKLRLLQTRRRHGYTTEMSALLSAERGVEVSVIYSMPNLPITRQGTRRPVGD